MATLGLKTERLQRGEQNRAWAGRRVLRETSPVHSDARDNVMGGERRRRNYEKRTDSERRMSDEPTEKIIKWDFMNGIKRLRVVGVGATLSTHEAVGENWELWISFDDFWRALLGQVTLIELFITELINGSDAIRILSNLWTIQVIIWCSFWELNL